MTWESTPIPGGWAFRNEEHHTSITLDYVIPKGTTYEAWVECRVDGVDIPLASGTVNISSPRAAAPFLATIGDSETNWAPGLQQAFYETVNTERDAIATVDLATIEPTDLMFVLDPLVEASGNTRLIAPGESGKSILADAIAATVSTGSHRYLGLSPQITGPVIYLDWETNAETHARRLKALSEPLGLAVPNRDLIHYRNESRPLWRSLQTVERAAKRCGAVLVIVDSRLPAAGPSGQSSGEEATINLHLALREIGVPALIIDHKSQEKMAKGIKGGYGNIFNDNLARMVWEMTSLTRQGVNSSQFLVELTKGNNVGSLPPLGFRLVTEGGKKGITSAQFTQVNPDVIRAGDDEGVGDRVDSLFQTSPEPLSVKRMADLTGLSQSSVRSYLNGRKGYYLNVNEGRSGKPGLWRPKEEYLTGPSDDGVQDSLDEPPSDYREGPEVY